MNNFYNLPTGPHKRIRIRWSLWLEIAEGLLQIVLWNFLINFTQKYCDV